MTLQREFRVAARLGLATLVLTYALIVIGWLCTNKRSYGIKQPRLRVGLGSVRSSQWMGSTDQLP